jgi:uncharacterized protein YbjT (DUF2867 family)
LIERSGLRWTFLRPGPFAVNCRNWWAPQIRTGDVVRWFYADAETAVVHERDIAAVAVRALLDDGHDGREHVLTGPESLTQREQVEIIGDAIGRPLRFEELSRESARDLMLGMKYPPAIADMLLDAYAAAVGQPALITSAILDVTGTPARSFRDWASTTRGNLRAHHSAVTDPRSVSRHLVIPRPEKARQRIFARGNRGGPLLATSAEHEAEMPCSRQTRRTRGALRRRRRATRRHLRRCTGAGTVANAGTGGRSDDHSA